ncbi:MAG: MFS transporter, partial [Proteobacteria bacterium]|nr:MFS transporter [Pseudomonadota bacterium]
MRSIFFTVFTSVTTIILLVSGLLTDSIGIRKSLIFAMVSRGLATVAIVVLAAMPDFPLRVALVTLCLILMAPSMAMMQTIYQSANARYTNAQSRSAGFNLWYLFMNLGATLSGFLVDIVRLSLGLSNTWIIGAGVISSVLGLIVMLTMIRTEAQFGDDGQFHKELSAKAQADQDSRKQKGPWNIFKELVSETAFWRFIALLSLLLGVRAVFVYVYLLMPKYWTRIMGEDAAIGTLNTINPILIVVGLVLFIPLSNKFNIFKMLVFGAIISSLSLFVLVLPWQATANILGTLGQTLHLGFLKNDFVAAYYALSILSQVLLSLGEVIWSPKLQEYTAAIAPEGQEGSYFGLSSIPWFLAKTVVSLMSGHMLSRWVPEGIGPRLRA